MKSIDLWKVSFSLDEIEELLRKHVVDVSSDRIVPPLGSVKWNLNEVILYFHEDT